MNSKNKLKLWGFVIALVGSACLCSPAGFFEQATEGFVDGAIETVEAGTGFSVEEIQATAEAVASGIDLEGIQATAEAAAGGITTGDDVETEFPVPEGATGLIAIGEGINFAVAITIEDAVEFYRTEFAALNLTERTLLTVIEDATVNLVFDGHANGKAVVVQMVDLGPLGININVRFEDI